jgi:hypothetical protein
MAVEIFRRGIKHSEQRHCAAHQGDADQALTALVDNVAVFCAWHGG